MNTEKLLALPDGRTLAYEHTGPSTSSIVMVFFSGTLSVGTAPRPSPLLTSKGVHYIAPTLPGYGNTSPPAKDVSYAVTIAGDISALIDHLYPGTPDMELYIAGGSFGTVPAQMLYGAPFDIFPHGRHIKRMLLLGAFPPPVNDKEKGFVYTRCMTWQNYIAVGPPAHIIPFRLVQRLLKPFIAHKFSSPANAQAFMREFLFDKMTEDEKITFKTWKEEKGYEEGQLEREMAEVSIRSVQKSWEGLMSTAEVLHSDWWGGKKLEELDKEHTAGRKVLVVAGTEDDAVPGEWGEYLVSKYPNARMKWIKGGHIAAIFHIEEIWAEFFDA